jgi:hypothetical protein
MAGAPVAIAYPPTGEDGPPSGAATADGAEPIANTAEKLANTDVIVGLLRNMVKSLREADDRRRDRALAPKAVICLGVSDRTHHDPPTSVRFHRRCPHIWGVVIRSAACG